MSIIDTRDLIKEANGLAGGDWEDIDQDVADELSEEDAERLEILTDLLQEVGNEARYGVVLISESEFEDYARQFAEDISAIPDDAQWPCTCIDWTKAASELQMDYTSVTFDGVDYLYRM